MKTNALASGFVLGFAWLVAAGLPAVAQQFQPPVQYLVGRGPVSVTVADVDRDGKPDLAVADSDFGAVGIMRGTGGGAFGRPILYAAGSGAAGVAAADLNGDGNVDLAVAPAHLNRISVLLGNGDGTFQPRVFYAATGCPSSVEVGDLNGDHRPDLVVIDACGSTVSVLLGKGDGTFRPHIDYSTGPGSEPYSAVLGDFNGDGNLDVATADFATSAVCVLFGNGDGTLQPCVLYPTSAAFPTSVAAGDFNGDGFPDLAVANSISVGPGGLNVFLGNGDGTFRPAVGYTTQVDPFAVAVGDFNRDGKLDLAVVSFQNSAVDLFLGSGDGTFQAKVPYAVGSGPVQLAVADLNGDDALDIVAVGASNSASVLLNTGQKAPAN